MTLQKKAIPFSVDTKEEFESNSWYGSSYEDYETMMLDDYQYEKLREEEDQGHTPGTVQWFNEKMGNNCCGNCYNTLQMDYSGVYQGFIVRCCHCGMSGPAERHAEDALSSFLENVQIATYE